MSFHRRYALRGFLGGGGSTPAAVEPLSVTANGTYNPPEGVDGYSPVTVHVASGSDEEWFNDGDTHIWITLNEGRTSPMLGVCPNGTVTVDWGDGTEPDTLTGTSTSTVKWTPTHNYAKPGDYIITLKVDGEMGIAGNSSVNAKSYLLRFSSSADGRNIVYQNTITRIELGNGVTSIGSYAFSSCYSLTSVVISDSVTSIGGSAFNGCDSLTFVVIPDSVTSIGDSAFFNCYSLASVVIPDSVTSIGGSAFSNCYGIAYYDFTNHTQVPTTSDTNAFYKIAADCEIRVPAALYDEWIAATNWSTHASKIVAV